MHYSQNAISTDKDTNHLLQNIAFRTGTIFRTCMGTVNFTAFTNHLLQDIASGTGAVNKSPLSGLAILKTPLTFSVSGLQAGPHTP